MSNIFQKREAILPPSSEWKYCPNCLLVQKLSMMGHITVEQRYQIQALQAAGNNQSEIAKILDRDKSVISRELRRNRLYNGKYKPEMAQSFYRTAGNDAAKRASGKALC